MARLLFYPGFPDRASLYDQLYRTIWHFLPMAEQVEEIVLPYAGADHALIDPVQSILFADVHLSRDFDPAIADYARRFEGKITIISQADIESYLRSRDFKGIMVWRASDSHEVGQAQALSQKSEAELVICDPESVQQETLEVIRFAFSLWSSASLSELLEESYKNFLKNLDLWKGQRISAFGNGPSLAELIEQKVDPGPSLRSVCNSTITDVEALSYLNPTLLFCGDPVQHCGVSLYAGQFRRSLAVAMDHPERVLITQLGYVPYFKEVVSESAHSRIIGVGNDRRAQFNLNLKDEFLTAATANIFTMLVLPVGLTIGHEINIYGCDGMPFGQATKPWSHAGEDDYMSKMSVTHRVHRGFWKRNYEEEYWSYTNDMEALISAAEEKGAIIRSMTPSWVPALARRYSSVIV